MAVVAGQSYRFSLAGRGDEKDFIGPDQQVAGIGMALMLVVMKHKEIVQIVRKRFRKIGEVFPRVTAHFEGPDIHTFRVEIKKLRAFLRLLAGTKGRAGKLKLPTQLNRFYHLTGYIRNLQLQQTHIRGAFKKNEEKLPQTYLRNLRREEENYIRLAVRLAGNKLSIKKEEKKLISALPGHLNARSRQGLIRLQSARLEKLAGSITPIPDETMHSIRKLIKDLLYTWPYIRREATRMLPVSLLSKKGGLAITKALGDLQDDRSSLQLLQASYIDPIAEERTILEELQRRWAEEKEKKKELINALVINSIHPRPSMT
jgi:CHAD domain-containing protein